MDKIIEEALEIFEQAYDAEAENRDTALKDLEFARLSDQWPEDVKTKRRQQGRPCLTVNQMPAFARQVVNEARQNNIGIKVRPADDDADVQTAEVYNGIIRNIEQQSDADAAYDMASENAVYLGFGYFRIAIEYAHDDSFDKELRIVRIPNAFSVYGDPYSTMADSSDWNNGFVTEWMPRETFHKKYPKADEVSWKGAEQNRATWADQDSIQLAEWWTREEVERKILRLSDGHVTTPEEYEANRPLFDALGVTVVAERMSRSYKVTQRLMTCSEVLQETAWAGCYIPIVPVYGDEINVEGKRILRSLIHDAKDSQQMLNFWRTAATELVALAPKAPWLMPEDAFPDDEVEAAKWDTANNDTWAYLTFKGSIRPERQAFAGIPAGAVNEALSARDDMKNIMGIHDASLGARSNETSGVAINARKAEGDTATYHFVDNLARGIRHGGRILIDLIPKVYTGERIVRILGIDGSVQNVKLGKKPNGQDQTAEGQAEEGAEEYTAGQALTSVYDLSAGKYDLVVDVGPAFVTQRQEAADQMMQLLQSFPAAAPIIGDLVAKNLDWPGADEISGRLKSLLPPQINDGIPPEITQKLQEYEAQMTHLMAENQSLKQMAQTDQGKNAVEMEKIGVDKMKIGVDMEKVQTDRIKAEAEAQKAKAEAYAAVASGQSTETASAVMGEIAVAAASLGQAAQQMQQQIALIGQAVTQPRIKRGRAAKQPDGSYAFESVEE